jgi:hypothetical protein
VVSTICYSNDRYRMPGFVIDSDQLVSMRIHGID